MTPQIPAAPFVINGWSIFAHPLFLEQLEALNLQVEALKRKDPHNFPRKNATKRLAAIAKLVFANIPRDPTAAEFRQGDTLGPKYEYWFRAKFFMQYRLFFRFHVESKVIALGWVNDEDTKRAYSAKGRCVASLLQDARCRASSRRLERADQGTSCGFGSNVRAKDSSH